MSDFYIYILVAAWVLICASMAAKQGLYGIALVLVLAVCVISPADADEVEPLELEDTWLDFSDFGMPTLLEPLEGKTKIFMGEAYSYHFDRSFNYNEVHENYGFEYQFTEKWGLNVASFENSYFERSNSLAVVYTWKYCDYGDDVSISTGLQGGIASGYEKAKYNAGGFAPIVAPFVDIAVYESIGARISVWNLYAANIAFYLEF
ncbi:TMhelix containing protein [Vibrio phage 1.044.O._10N.261.51.B8]|uniref:TMhelix containing protein n=2 Tax=Autolykiviridae TaxID=2184034 RepID=A0A2I7QR75_9VIRU|nr:antimicrobial peptide resistance and lipid A acylation protein PagP [Vibrio phage 1.044.O._10N.261.51.B8]AUR83886.1 TMhelix containing protein [Vibrio phage 1.043.O._10N.261.52.C7]AUR83907.1 TMhelix containing protein [Vibrio phage 1.044.O._10N.261.51.B8]